MNFWRRLLGFPEPQPKEPPVTPAQIARIYADAFAANAHEDELFDAFQKQCNAQGIEFDFASFFKYAGEHWRMDYDPYGYRAAFLKGVPHPYVETLERAKNQHTTTAKGKADEKQMDHGGHR